MHGPGVYSYIAVDVELVLSLHMQANSKKRVLFFFCAAYLKISYKTICHKTSIQESYKNHTRDLGRLHKILSQDLQFFL